MPVLKNIPGYQAAYLGTARLWRKRKFIPLTFKYSYSYDGDWWIAINANTFLSPPKKERLRVYSIKGKEVIDNRISYIYYSPDSGTMKLEFSTPPSRGLDGKSISGIKAGDPIVLEIFDENLPTTPEPAPNPIVVPPTSY